MRDEEKLAAGLVLAAALCVSVVPVLGAVHDPDAFWHFATGELILREGVPRADPFSWSAAGARWVPHEWGYEALIAAARRAGGYPGAVTAHAVLAAGLVLSVFRLARVAGASKAGAAGCALLAALMLQPVLVLRPQVASYGLFAWWLGRLLEGRARWAEGAAVAVLWANLHGSFPLLPGLTAAWALLSPGRRAALGLMAALQAAAACLNPAGPGLWAYAVWCAFRPEFRAISEWQSWDFSQPLAWPVLALACLLPVVAGKSRGLSRPVLPVAAVCMGAALVSARYYAYFVLAAVPVLSPLLDQVRGRALAAASVVLAVVLAVVAGVSLPGDVVAGDGYPVGGVDYVQAAGLERVIAEYTWGGYLIFRGVPVFIDGRADVYVPTAVWDEYLRFRRGEGTAEVASRWKAGACLLEPGSRAGKELVRAGWQVAYSDRVCEVLVPAGGVRADERSVPVGSDPH
ncbi:MAG: hypothetical protein AB1816_01815 [Bacillota bacterium]